MSLDASTAIQSPAAKPQLGTISGELQHLNLDFDILFLLLDYLDQKSDILSMMRTCKTLRQAGYPRLLYDPTIKNIHQLRSLFSFVLSEGREDEFCLLIRRLTLQFNPEDAEIYPGWCANESKLVFEAFRRTTQLNFLFVDGQYVDILFRPESPALQSLCSLPALDSLVIIYASVETTDIIANLQAPIKRLHVAFDFINLSEPGPDPVVMTQSIRSTLTTLALGDVDFRNMNLHLPHVRSLSTRMFQYPEPSPLISALPNLLELFVVYCGLDYEWDSEDVLPHRSRNRELVSQLTEPWTKLDALSGRPLALFAMALPCRVRCLEIKSSEGESPDLVYTLLDDFQPSVLALEVMMENATLDDLKVYLRLLLRRVKLSRLRLTIDLSYSSIDVAELRNMIPTAFSGIALDTMTLKLRNMSYSKPYKLTLAPGPTLEYLERADSDALAQDIAQAISQLRYFSLDLSEATAQRSDPVEYWSVRGSSESGSTSLERMSRDEGGPIMSEGYVSWDPSFAFF